MNEPVVVMLKWSEVISAVGGGTMRTIRALSDTRQLEHGRDRFDSWGADINGAIAECALAKFTNTYWAPAVGFLDTELGDVGKMQVKSTTRQNGCLVVRPQDEPSFPFVLVTVATPRLDLRGWMWGYNAKTDKYWRDIDRARGIHQAAWFVPQQDLEPMQSLPNAHPC